MNTPNRRLGLLAATGIALLAISIPVLAASPAPPPSGAAGMTETPDQADESEEPGKSGKPDKAAKSAKAPETAISVTGIVREATDVKGRPVFTMTVSGRTWTLSAGPSWFWGDKNPLAAFVGTSIAVAGTTRAGDAEIDVETVDGTALREPGKPPWAGGPWVVGKTHPGWKTWMADGKPGKGHGKDGAPGQVDKESAAP